MTGESTHLLVEALDGSSERLAERAQALGFEPISVADLDDACRVLRERRHAIASVLIPTDIPARCVKKAVKAMRTLGPASGLAFVSIGKSPPSAERKKLRSAGLQLALWEPYADGTLRFQLNRALCGNREPHGRAAPRVPTYLLGRIFVGERSKDAIIYSLSELGAFLETPRASVEGALIEVEIRLPENPLRVQGLVAFANVPGNLHRQNLPLGVGVRFKDMPHPERRALEDYVRQRMADLNV